MRTIFYTVPPNTTAFGWNNICAWRTAIRRILIRLKKSPEYVHVNGRHVRVVDPVYTGDQVRIIQEDTPRTPPNHTLEVPIVYEDDDVIVFDKPARMPVHPSRNHAMDTLGNFFAAYCERTGQELIFRPVTRLDADTTGFAWLPRIC